MKNTNLVESLLGEMHAVPLTFENADNEVDERNVIRQFVAEMKYYGYYFDEETNDNLLYLRLTKDSKLRLKEILDTARKITGGEHSKPLFPMFPNYESLSSDELVILNRIYYMTGLRLSDDMPNLVNQYDLESHARDFIEVHVVNKSTIQEMINNVFNSPTVISLSTKQLLTALSESEYSEWFIDDSTIHNKNVPLKENLVFLTSIMLKARNTEILAQLMPYFSNPVDSLRLAYALVGEDLKVSLATPKFKFSRFEIRTLLEILDYTVEHNGDTSMRRYEQQFKALGRVIHPTTEVYKKRYPSAYIAYIALMNNKLKGDWRYRKINELLTTDDNLEASRLFFLGEPTLLVKNLYALALKYAEHRDFLIEMLDIAVSENDYARPSNLSLMQAFRVFGDVDYSPLYMIKNQYVVPSHDYFNRLPYDFMQTIASLLIKGLVNTKTDNHKAYFDKALYKITLPVNERMTSTQFINLPKMSRIPISKDTDTLRTFVYWKNGVADNDEEIIDLDSAVIAYSKQVNNGPLICSWDSSLNLDDMIEHSGDITNANPNAVEYQDIKIKELAEKGYDSITLFVSSFNGQHFSDINTASAGIMEFNSNEEMNNLWSPEHVLQNVQLTGTTTNLVALTIDLQKMELTWVNTSTPTNSMEAYYSVYTDSKIGDLVYKLKTKPITIGDLVHAYYGDDLVDDEALADEGYVFKSPMETGDNLNFSKMFPTLF